MENSDDYAAHFELIARVSAGDMDAYDAMYRQYVAGATRVARTVANSIDESTDVVFEAFARLLVRLREHGEPEVGIDEYLRTTIRRLAVERHPDVTQGDVPPPHPDDPIGTHDRFTRVRRAYEALPDEWQQILWHAEVERKPQLVLARGLDMTQSTVASLVLRSREGLRQAYGAIALADDVADGCRDFAPNIPVHVKGMLPAKVGRELDKHLRRCDGCRKFRDDYVLLLSDLRQTLFGALLRPADPTAVPVGAPVAAGVGTGVAAAAEVAAAVDPGEVDGVARDNMANSDDVETRESPAVPPAAPAAVIAGMTVDDDFEETPRDGRRRGLLVGGVVSVAAATIFGAFALLGGGPDTEIPSADDGYSDGGAGLGGGGAEGRVLGAAPTVAVLSESVDDAAGDVGFVPVNGDARDESGGDDDGGQANDVPGDPSTPLLPDSDDPDGTSPGDRSSPSAGPSEPSRDPSPQGDPAVAPSFTSHPQSTSAEPGDTVTFSVGVNGSPEPMVRWQRRTSSGGSWSTISGATSTTLSVTVTAAKDDYQYRTLATNDGGSATSRAATLTVEYPPPTIDAHPQHTSTDAGGEVTFTASATSSSDPSFTDVWWEEYANGAWTRMNIEVPAAENTSLTLSDVQQSRDGARFRAVFANEFGSTATNAAELTVTAP